MSRSKKPRAWTTLEAREKFLARIASSAKYWADLPDKTPQERCDGVAFSIMCIFDGVTITLPAMNIALSPHPSDKSYHRTHGENWFKPGQVINEDSLHELYHEVAAKLRSGS